MKLQLKEHFLNFSEEKSGVTSVESALELLQAAAAEIEEESEVILIIHF